jgi:hypothetical protein
MLTFDNYQPKVAHNTAAQYKYKKYKTILYFWVVNKNRKFITWFLHNVLNYKQMY